MTANEKRLTVTALKDARYELSYIQTRPGRPKSSDDFDNIVETINIIIEQLDRLRKCVEGIEPTE